MASKSYNSSGAIVINPEDDKKLQDIQSSQRILISKINDCVDRGQLNKRHELLTKSYELHKQEMEILDKYQPPKVEEKYKKEFVDLSKVEELKHPKVDLQTKIKTNPWWKFW